MNRFIKFNPESDLLAAMIAKGRHREVILLSVMAMRARRADDPVTGLKAGQCFLGDIGSLGMTEKQYRVAKKNLEKFGLASFKGASQGTVGTILNTEVYDINASEQGEQRADEGRSRGDQGASNKKDKNVKKEKNTTGGSALDLSKLPDGVSEELARDFIEHRKQIKKPLTQRALDLCLGEAAKAPDHGLTPEEVINETIVAGWMKPNPEWVVKRLGNQAPANNVTPLKRKNGPVRDEHGQIKGWWMFEEFHPNPEYRRPA